MVTAAEFDEIEGAGEAGAELDLSESDSLPWLEADEDEDEGGLDIAQIVGFGAVLLLLLIGVLGAIYLLTNRTSEDAPIADGSTIEAPAGPIKERPEDPQGKEFAGTGNVAPAVGEGQTRMSQIGDGSDAASGSSGAGTKPVDAGGNESASSDTASGSGEAATASSSSSSSTSTSGVGVQLAAYSTRSRAEQGWSQLVRQTDALAGVRYRVVEGQVDSGTVYRLQAVASDRAAADALCRAIKADGLDCAVKP